jgi:hypothetical protein
MISLPEYGRKLGLYSAVIEYGGKPELPSVVAIG